MGPHSRTHRTASSNTRRLARPNRHRLIPLLIAGLLAATVVSPATATSEDPEPASGVSVGLRHLGDSLNPLTSFEPALRALGQAVWPAALNLATPTGEPEPGVVVEVPTVDNGGVTVNADGTATIRYEIDAAAVWEDGTPISAADFVFSHDVICNEAAGAVISPRMQLCPGAHPDGIEVIDGPTALGPKSVEVTLDQPTLEYARLFSAVLPEHDVAGTDVLNDWDDQMWLSGGPFRFVDWEPGEWVELERNPNYWQVDPDTGGTLPHLDRVVFRSYDTGDAVTDAFAQRQVDVAPWLPGPFEEVVALRDDGADVQVADHSSIVEVLYFNFRPGRFERNPGSLNEHLQFRRAVAHAIDRDAIAQQLYGGEVSGTHSVTTPSAPHISHEPWDRYPRDVEAVGDLLTELETELETDFETSPPTIDVIMFETATVRMELAQEDGMLSHDLADVGIELTAEGMSAAEWSELVLGDKQAWDTTILGWSAGSGTVGAASLLSVFSPSAPAQFGSWGDGDVGGEAADAYEQLLEQLQATIDFDEAAELIRQAEAILADQMVVLPLFAHPDLGGVWPDRVAGFEATPGLSLGQIELWREIDDAPPFSDIAGTTHEHAIIAIAEEAITTGFEDGTFRPGDTVTRGQMATFLTRALDLAPWEEPESDDALPFPDIAGTTHEESILVVAQAGIAHGFEDGTFRPGDAVTRGQMATFLTRALDLPEGSATFPDTGGTTHEESIAAVAEADIAVGFPDGTYRPEQAVTRGQMATFLARALNLI